MERKSWCTSTSYGHYQATDSGTGGLVFRGNSLASASYPLANANANFSLVDDRGVVAGTCADEGWNYVFSTAEDRRTPQWDQDAIRSHRNPGTPLKKCGYGYNKFFDGVVNSPIMLDIGANMGKSLLPYSVRGWRVIAFEPIPANVRTIRRNLFINGITEDKVAIVEGAASNHSNSMEIYAPKGRTDNTAVSLKGATTNVRGEVDVFSIRGVEIDKYIDNAVSPNLGKHILLVKIDTQGHELSVFQGMKRFLENPPSTEDLGGWGFVVVAEYNPDLQKASGHEPHEMLDFMRNLGYEVRCNIEAEVPILPPEIPTCEDVIFSKGKPQKGLLG